MQPGPFLGAPDAPVVFLNLNPGCSPGDEAVHAGPAFSRTPRASPQLQLQESPDPQREQQSVPLWDRRARALPGPVGDRSARAGPYRYHPRRLLQPLEVRVFPEPVADRLHVRKRWLGGRFAASAS